MSEDPKPNLWLVLTPAMAQDLRTGTLTLCMKEDGEIEHVRQEDWLAEPDPDLPDDHVYTPEEIRLRERFKAFSKFQDMAYENRLMSEALDKVYFAGPGDQWKLPPEPKKGLTVISGNTGEKVSIKNDE